MIKIISVGKIKEPYWQAAINEYQKRLSKYHKIELIEVKESKKDIASIALAEELVQIEKHVTPSDYLITLEIEGTQYSSTELATKLDQLFITNATIVFVIGGSHGLHLSIKEKSKESLSFSKLTFPHQLFRVLLLEQLYRSFKIEHNEPYHK